MKNVLKIAGGLMATALATTGVAAMASTTAGASSPPVTTKVSIVVDGVDGPGCHPYTLSCNNSFGVHVVPDHIPVGPVVVTLLDRRPLATRSGTPRVQLQENGFNICDTCGHTLVGDGATTSTSATSTTSSPVTLGIAGLTPVAYPTTPVSVIPTGAPYHTATHVDATITDSPYFMTLSSPAGGSHGAALDPLVADVGQLDVSVIDQRTNPQATGPLNVNSDAALPINITAPAGETCGVTVVCSQVVAAATALSSQTVRAQVPGTPPCCLELGYLTTRVPTLGSSDDATTVSLSLNPSNITATNRDNRYFENSSAVYTTYHAPASGNTSIIIDNNSGASQQCSIPGVDSSFTVGKTSKVNKRASLSGAFGSVTVQCVNGSTTSTFVILPA